jgi:hypothetical protein
MSATQLILPPDGTVYNPAYWACRPDVLPGTARVAVCSVYRATAARGPGASECEKHGLTHAERSVQAAIVRDLLGNPFRPVPFDPDWITRTVRSLAQAAYEERVLPAGHLDPARLAVLAGALEDGGCTDAAILRHLRGTGPHVRGCRVLDLLLSRS